MVGPSIRIGSLPTFNNEDRGYRITGFDGWWGAAAPRAELVASGGAPGAVAVGPWDDSEAYYTLSGVIRAADRATLMTVRRQLLAALPATEEVPIDVLGNGEDIDLRVYVRRYDKPELDVVGLNLNFTFPLVAPDPQRYALEPLSGALGVFTGSTWFATAAVNTTPDPDVYYLSPLVVTGEGFIVFQQEEPEEGDFPPALVITSPGDISSRRVTVTVTGPLTAGDWTLMNETTGDELFADVTLVAGQSIVFDSYTQQATLSGTNIDSLVFGNYPTLEPGENIYRLVAGTHTDGFASVSAQPAYS